MKNQHCKVCGKTEWVHLKDEYPDDYGYTIIEHYECKNCRNKASKSIKVTFTQENSKKPK